MRLSPTFYNLYLHIHLIRVYLLYSVILTDYVAIETEGVCLCVSVCLSVRMCQLYRIDAFVNIDETWLK